jgi:nucleoside-diphosphate-sugar epimerase
MKLAVIGADGFVGAEIIKAIKSDGKYDLISIVRSDDISGKIEAADLVIHAANPAKRFMAEKEPINDFVETAEKTFSLLKTAKEKKFILISTLSCRTQLNTNYGRNRRFCELMALNQGASVIRLGPMFGGSRKQDLLHDLLAGKKIYVSAETKYAYVDVEWVGQKILNLINKKPNIYEIGAKNSISLAHLRDFFNSSSIFEGPDDTQIPETKDDGPDAKLVIEYAKKEFINLNNWI